MRKQLLKEIVEMINNCLVEDIKIFYMQVHVLLIEKGYREAEQECSRCMGVWETQKKIRGPKPFSELQWEDMLRGRALRLQCAIEKVRHYEEKT